MKYFTAEFVERRKWKPHSRMVKGNDIPPRYISTLCLDTIYKVYTFDSSDKSRAVQEDGLAGTSASSCSSTPKYHDSTCDNLRQEFLRFASHKTDCLDYTLLNVCSKLMLCNHKFDNKFV